LLNLAVDRLTGLRHDTRHSVIDQEVSMRRYVVYAAALLVVLASALLVAQAKVTTAEELDKIMKKASAFRQVDKAVQSNNPADARAQLAVVKAAVAESQSFWVTHKKDDAVKMNKESLAKLDALEKVLSADAFDVAAATAAFKEAGGACRACHQQYRFEDEKNEYHLKPGSVAGVSE
jgi:cytochrome c556